MYIYVYIYVYIYTQILPIKNHMIQDGRWVIFIF